MKLQALSHTCFSVKFVKFLRTPFFYRIPPVAASEFCKLDNFVS